MQKFIRLDAEELRKSFRVRDGKLERLNMQFKNGGKWHIVKNVSNTDTGYCRININKKTIRYHRILWVLHTGEDVPYGYQLDHINGDKLDNRIENLRVVTNRENSQNKEKHRNGKKAGVSYSKADRKYKSAIQINLKEISLGGYETELIAYNAYMIACKHIEDYVDNKSFRDMIKSEIKDNGLIYE